MPLSDLRFASLLNDRIELTVTSDFNLLTEDALKIKYPSEHKNNSSTNESVGIEITLNYTRNKANRYYIPTCKDNFVKPFNKTHPAAEWLTNRIK